jgi:hypothetical protein
MLLLAVAGLLASYIGVSGTVLWSRQLLWLGIGIGAVGVGGLGVMGWLLVAFRNVRLRQAAASAALLSRLVLDDSTRSPHTLGGPPAGADDAAVATYVAADGMTHYHRPGCLLLREKTTHPVVPGADLTPCGVCLS